MKFTSLKLLLISLLNISLVLSPPSYSEAFGNSAVFIPKIGAAFYDSSFIANTKPWGLSHQYTVGTSFMQAIDYRWWWVLDTGFAIGEISKGGYLASFMGGAGLRYNIFLDDFRPHTGIAVHYLQFLGDGVKNLPLNLGWPIFVGLKPYLGLEWLFYSEMALVLEGSYAFYVNLNEAFRHLLYASAAFALYF